MAFSNVKVFLEIGHEAVIKSKRTFEGFTHDWEVYVRGADNTDISHFVEKVVFHLHSTFHKPKRVIKEPPYLVKEKGWAGFTLPIDIYFKNLDEPKKVHYEYDLQLQTSGPSMTKCRREKFTFPNPSEDLRRRLIRGGGVGTSENEVSRFAPSPDKPADDVAPLKLPAPLVGKPKLGGDSIIPGKKLKGKDDPPRGNDEFSDVFGTPIHTNSKASPDSKKSLSSSMKSVEKSSVDKHSSGGKSSKHIPQKEVKDKGSSKEESKERSKDKEKSKEKSLKHLSAAIKRPQSPKRSGTPPKQSGPPSKRPASPHKRPTTPQLKDETKKKIDETKVKNDSKSTEDSKGEKRKKYKKSSKEEKSKKVKLKGHDKKREETLETVEKSSKEKEKKLPEPKEISRKESEKMQGKHADYEKDHDKLKHKHKKKEKHKQGDGDKDRSNDKGKSSKKVLDTFGDVKDKEKNGVGIELSDVSKKKSHSASMSPLMPNSSPVKQLVTSDKLTSTKDKPVKRPLKQLLAELADHESSESNISPSSDEDDSSFEAHMPIIPKKLPKTMDDASLSSSAKATQSIESVVNSYERSPVNSKAHGSKLPDNFGESYGLPKHNDKPKNKSETKKKKEKNESGGKSATKDKVKGEKDTAKRKRKNSDNDNSKVDCTPPKKIAKDIKETAIKEDTPAVSRTSAAVVKDDVDKSHYSAKAAKTIDEVQPVSTIHDRFTADYVAQLKDLQQKIMTLDNNTELQRVVQLIAETGHYEITKKTFDFDLCELDQMTVKRLQDFFVAT